MEKEKDKNLKSKNQLKQSEVERQELQQQLQSHKNSLQTFEIDKKRHEDKVKKQLDDIELKRKRQE